MDPLFIVVISSLMSGSRRRNRFALNRRFDAVNRAKDPPARLSDSDQDHLRTTDYPISAVGWRVRKPEQVKYWRKSLTLQ